MSEEIEKCNNIIEKFTHGYKIKFCNGYYMKEDPTEEEIDEFFEYYEDIVINNKGWIYDFLCAINNRKICMIDNDFFPDDFKNLISVPVNVNKEEVYNIDDKLYYNIIDEYFKQPKPIEVEEYFDNYYYFKEDESSKKLLFLRYIFLTKCNLKMLVILINNDPTVIYYKKDKWEEALLLYLYHEEKIDKNIIYISKDELRQYNIDEETINNYIFHIFQSVLLGYNIDSLIRYLFLKPEEIDISNISSLTSIQKNELYKNIYKMVYIDNNNEIENIKKLYERTLKVIEKLKLSLKIDPKWRYFAYGLYEDDILNF